VVRMDFSVIFNNSINALFNAEALYLALAALGLNIHFGYTGLLNFGQVGFLTVAAYGLGTGVTYLGLPFGLAILLGLGLAVLLALLLGIPTLRLRADYLAIVTIASSEVLRLVARSATLRDVTGGSSGLTGFSGGFYTLNPFDSGFSFGPFAYSANRLWLLVVGWTFVVLGSLLVFMLMRSPWGRVLKAIREDEDAVRSLGKNVVGYKMQSLILGGIFGALGGFVFALANSSVQPDNYSTLLTFFAFTAMILGGAGRILGPVIGAIIFSSFFTFLENFLVQAVRADIIPTSIMNSNQVGIVRFILVGVLLMALMIFRPQGIFGDKKELALDAR
jgi:neutral amino acid transport system permease protein